MSSSHNDRRAYILTQPLSLGGKSAEAETISVKTEAGGWDYRPMAPFLPATAVDDAMRDYQDVVTIEDEASPASGLPLSGQNSPSSSSRVGELGASLHQRYKSNHEEHLQELLLQQHVDDVAPSSR